MRTARRVLPAAGGAGGSVWCRRLLVTLVLNQAGRSLQRPDGTAAVVSALCRVTPSGGLPLRRGPASGCSKGPRAAPWACGTAAGASQGGRGAWSPQLAPHAGAAAASDPTDPSPQSVGSPGPRSAAGKARCCANVYVLTTAGRFMPARTQAQSWEAAAQTPWHAPARRRRRQTGARWLAWHTSVSCLPSDCFVALRRLAKQEAG